MEGYLRISILIIIQGSMLQNTMTLSEIGLKSGAKLMLIGSEKTELKEIQEMKPNTGTFDRNLREIDHLCQF